MKKTEIVKNLTEEFRKRVSTYLTIEAVDNMERDIDHPKCLDKVGAMSTYLASDAMSLMLDVFKHVMGREPILDTKTDYTSMLDAIHASIALGFSCYVPPTIEDQDSIARHIIVHGNCEQISCGGNANIRALNKGVSCPLEDDEDGCVECGWRDNDYRKMVNLAIGFLNRER